MKSASNKEAKSKRQQEDERAFVEMMAATSNQEDSEETLIPHLTDEYTGAMPPWDITNPSQTSHLASALDASALPVLEEEVVFPLSQLPQQQSLAVTTDGHETDIPVLNDVFLEPSATQDVQVAVEAIIETDGKRKARIDSSSIDDMVLAMLPKIKLEVRKAVLHEMVEIEKTLVKKIEQQLIKAILKEFHETGRYQ